MNAVSHGNRPRASSCAMIARQIVDPYGRVTVQSDLFEQAVLVDEVRLLSGLTVYRKVGDLFAYLCAVLTTAAICCSFRSAMAS